MNKSVDDTPPGMLEDGTLNIVEDEPKKVGSFFATRHPLGAHKLGMNPYHDEKGRFATSDGAVKQYMFSSEFEKINDYLRNGGYSDERRDLDTKVAAIDKDLAENGRPVPAGVKLWRGLHLPEDDPLLDKLKVGGVFVDQGYVATTTAKAWAEHALKGNLGETDVLLQVIPSTVKNPKAIYNPREFEFLFQRGNHFKVKSVTRSEGRGADGGRLDVVVHMTRLIK
jgi:hypothetical protein